MKNRSAAVIFPFLVILAGFGCAGRANGQSVSNADLVKYAQAAARGQATEQQKAVLFANNERLNNLAMAGKIPDSDYQHNQRAFVEKNDELIRNASSRHGLAVAPPKNAETYKAGTDTDRQLQNPQGDLTVEHVKKVRQEYNQEVGEYLKSQGVKSADGENWAKKLTTDIMPSPYDMKPSDFKNANTYINSEGGLAYTSADAAKLQLSIDGGRPQSPSMHEAAAFHSEMQKKTVVMNNEIQRLNRERSNVSDPAEIENIDTEIRKYTAFMSKYLGRDSKAAELAGGNADKIKLSEDLYSGSSAEKIKQAQKRDTSKKTRNAEVFVGAVNEHLAQNATRKFNDAIAGAAVAGGNEDAAKNIIAGNIKNLSGTQKTQAIADLEIKYGSDFARGVNAELKKGNRPQSSPGRKTTISNSLGLVNTVLNIGNQYAEGKTTTQILWNMSIGSTLESVNKETADYTAREIERLKLQYIAAGEDPESTAVKLKIMGEATLKGTFHGTMIGSYDLLKSATHTAAGAAATAADSAIFLVGEALDTRNVLETTFAEMQAQNMEQSVQNAKAVKFGKDTIVELKRLANEAAYLKSVLEQNARSARQFCRECDGTLDDLKSGLREINNLKETDTLKALPETEKRIATSLAETESALQTMTRQAEASRRALTLGGDPKEALLAVQVLAAGYDKHAGIIVTCKNELFKIGELSSLNSIETIIADFEARKAALAEQGRQGAANAQVMRKNEVQYKKSIAAFDRLKERVEKSEAYFADKRQTNESDWIVIKSKLRGIARPDGNMPEDFFGEVGTLERLPEKIRSEAGQLKPAAVTSPGGSPEIGGLADAALERLTPPYNTAARALTVFKETLDALREAAGRKPEPPIPSTAGLTCPSVANTGETIHMSVALPSTGSGSSSSGGSPGIFDPYDGHDPDSPEGMLALLNYKRAVESGHPPARTGQSADSGQSPGFLVSWDFGDGTISGKSSAKSASHAYRNPGRYTIRVSICTTNEPNTAVAVNATQITIQPPKGTPEKTPAKPPVQSDGRLPCGHMPGECAKSGIKSIRCMLHSGQISSH
ncbi:MAG TPA: PKD domain-containing protein [Candidatus Ozemobacteraceae bacterium]|nr:PKD domain-containing protein [Candidatus Ozemobacteraceae bacterium]